MSAATVTDWTVTEPGVVHGMPEAVYLADPVEGRSLSHSGAKTILRSPAQFAYEREYGRADRTVFDLGKTAHTLLLGVGGDIAVVEADSWQTKAAKEARSAARERGATPVLREQYEEAKGLAEAVRAHPVAGPLFDPQRGEAEVSMFWRDQRSGVMLRCRHDTLRPSGNGRLTVADLKTTDDASPEAFSRAAYNLGYYIQHPFYVDGIKALGVHDDPDFVFVVVERHPPYLISICHLDLDAQRLGRAKARRAIDTYAYCAETGDWYGYGTPTTIHEISLPRWADYEEAQ